MTCSASSRGPSTWSRRWTRLHGDSSSAPRSNAPSGSSLWGCGILGAVPSLRPSVRALAAAVVALALADWAIRLAGDSFVPGGPLDEIAHLLTTLIVIWALGPRIYDRL